MKLKLLIGLAVLFISPLAVQAVSVDLNTVTLRSSKATVTADGIDQTIIRVSVKTPNYLAASGAMVRLTSSRGTLDEITPAEATTNGFGSAEFLVRSLRNGTTTIMVEVEGQKTSKQVGVSFVNGLDVGLAPGSLIKIPSDND